MTKKYSLIFATVSLLIMNSSYVFAEDANEEENTIVTHDAFIIDPLTQGEKPNPWTAPNYANQEKSLGWNATAFAVPSGMQERVNFWLDIYTKYSTDQGVLQISCKI